MGIDSFVSFEDNSTAVFKSNSGETGGAIFSFYVSYLSFEGSSKVSFDSNRAVYEGGAIFCGNVDITISEEVLW